MGWWSYEIRLGDIIQVIGLLFSPVVALRFQRRMDRDRDRRAARERIFRDLMASRGNWTSPARVNAINMIDVEFYGGGEREASIREAAAVHLDSLTNTPSDSLQRAITEDKQRDSFIRLINLMAQSLGYKFSDTHIKNSVYLPVGHVQFQEDMDRTRKLTLEILEGKRPLPVTAVITDIPPARQMDPASVLPESSVPKLK